METSSDFIASFVVFCAVTVDYFVDREWNEIFNTFKNPKLFLIFLFLQAWEFFSWCDQCHFHYMKNVIYPENYHFSC